MGIALAPAGSYLGYPAIVAVDGIPIANGPVFALGTYVVNHRPSVVDIWAVPGIPHRSIV